MMWRRLVTAAAIAVTCTSPALAQDLASTLNTCSQDTGPAGCPTTYQALRATECLGTGGNRACLLRMAKQAAAANDCGRAYQLVYACGCDKYQDATRDTIKAAGQDAVCKALKG